MHATPSLLKCTFATLVLVFTSMNSAHANQPIDSFLWKASVATTVALIAKTNPLQADRMSTEIGGGEHFSVGKVAAQWDWNDDLLTVFGWSVSSYWQLEFSKWQSQQDSSQYGANLTAGVIPMFRFTGDKAYYQPYVDVGVGVSVFTDSRIGESEFGSNFQFTDVFGIGINFGKRNQWGLGYKFQHYSNGSVRAPNSGINFNLLNLTYKY
jgi:lipid A 3-O-deacylase